MTFETTWDAGAYDQQRRMGQALPQRLGGLVLGCVALLCAYTVCVHLGAGSGQADLANGASEQADTPAPRGDKLVTRGDRLASHLPRLSARLDAYALLFDPRSWGATPGRFALAAAVEAAVRPAARPAVVADAGDRTSALPHGDRIARSAAAPMPLHAPPVHTASLRGRVSGVGAADSGAEQEPAQTADHKPNFFERLFGKPSPLRLAYAAPDDTGIASDQSGILGGRYDRYTAVYDISAHVVYMPDGTKLEAHSGLGSHLDDPRSADERGRGVTPPDVYDLVPRESLFHGVRALRLIPEDQSKVFGRSGLLAHTFMLGPSGQSFGCVSFRDYSAFLQAYKEQKIKRLAVVASLD